MKIRIGIMKLIATTLLLSLGMVAAETSVLLKADNMQKITSSTLKWIPLNGEVIHRDAVVGAVEYTPNGINESDLYHLVNTTDRSLIRENKIYICRINISGKWIPGALFDQSRVCVVSLFDKVYQQKEPFEVLHNVDQAARLVWKDWERSTEIPLKAVAAGEYYVAHTASRNLKIYSDKLAIGRSHWIGKIDPREGVFGKLSVVDETNETINDVEKGQVLVEIEPVMYELTVAKLITEREKVNKKMELKLGEVTIRNDLTSTMKGESVIAYQWQYFSNWGQGKAMLRGLLTKILFPNSSDVEEISWGINKEEIRDDIYCVEEELEAGTAMQLTLQANLFEIEIPYTGWLLSVFDDSHTMNRTIQGTWLRTLLADIEPVRGPKYFLHNNSLVPTTSTTTSTTTTTTTTEATTVVTIPTESSTKYNENVSTTTHDDHDMPDPGKHEQPDTHGDGNSNSIFACSYLISTLFAVTIGRYLLLT